MTLPDGQTTEYTYDVMDRMTEVYQNDELLAEYDYNKNSQLIENNRNELKTTYEYDALGQLTELTTQKGYEDIMNFTYEYDKIGNITSEVRTESDTVNERSYLYDSANQLIGFTDNDYSESYTYDNAGNMLTKSINDTITSYSYNEANQLVEETLNGKTIGYTYNVNGDLVQKSTGEEYSYDIQGNLTAIIGNGIDQSFTYNGNGHRMSKTDDGETIYYVNDINLTYEQVLQTYNDDGIINTYTYGVERIQSVGETNETYLYDGRGSVVGTINQDNILESYSYTAYGELMPDSPAPKVWGYNGEDTDSKTGLQYLRARYYNPSISRFEQKDAWRGLLTENNSLNRYDYCYNNPVIYHDDGGHIPLEGVYGRGNYGRTYSSSIATVTSYRESDNTDDSDGYNFAETGIPNINNSSNNNDKLPTCDNNSPITPNSMTFEEWLICSDGNGYVGVSDMWNSSYGNEAFALLGEMIAEGFLTIGEALIDFYNEMVQVEMDRQEMVVEITGNTSSIVTNDIINNANIESYALDILEPTAEDVDDTALNGANAISIYREPMSQESAQAIFDAYDNTYESGAYYEDISVTGGYLIGGETGVTFVVNLDNNYIAQYNHSGGMLTASLSPLDVKATSGTVCGANTANRYTGWFLQGGVAAIGQVEGATSFFDGTYGDVTQTGNGMESNIGIAVGLSYYTIVQSYSFD